MTCSEPSRKAAQRDEPFCVLQAGAEGMQGPFLADGGIYFVARVPRNRAVKAEIVGE
jgi:hypothetical protein